MIIWRKASRSGGHGGGECVEIAALPSRLIGIRDSKDPHGPRLHLTDAAWTDLLSSVRDLPSPNSPR
jgi:uncharacterized protein DUF397